MNVLMINSLYPPHIIGGAEKSVALLAEAVARRGHKVTALTLARDQQEQSTVQSDVQVERMPIQNLYWPFEKERDHSPLRKLRWHLRDSWNNRYNQAFESLLDRVQPDVIHSNNLTGLSTEFWPIARNRGIRIVHTLRDYSLLCSRAALFKKGRDCERRCVDCALLTMRKKQLSQSVDCVASNSRYVIDAHKRHGYFRNLPDHVIYNIADMPSAIPANDGVRPDELVFGFIGRIEPEKGIEVVLAATRRLPAEGWRLKIAGAGRDDYVAALKARYSQPQIEWLDFVDPHRFYNDIDTCLIASVWPEPLPRTLIESFAYGRSVICSDAGGIPEIASLGPVSLTYPRNDATALARAMAQAVANRDLWRLRGRPHPRAMEQFAEATVAERYLSLYRGD
jgi:glycosyltransferase involved in cell wall biosynthesis